MSDIPATRRCIYCFQCKLVGEFSLEHIWPDALGGSLCDDLFKTKEVCAKCNNICGLFVDGAFIKTWFVQTEIANQGSEFLDPSKPTAVPLQYLESSLIFQPMPAKFANAGRVLPGNASTISISLTRTAGIPLLEATPSVEKQRIQAALILLSAPLRNFGR